MIVGMDWRIVFHLCEVIFMVHTACSSEFSPPKRVKVESSVLTWWCPEGYTIVTYTVQCNTTLKDWFQVYHGTQQQFNFSTTAEDFYGRRFRVRSEVANQTSDWVESKLVQCAHLHTCAPLIELKVKRDKVDLWMKHRDPSLKAEEGGHIEFRSRYWKRNSVNEMKEKIINSGHTVFEELESGQEYCFQVDYLLFGKPHGKPSREICEVIPETSKERTLRVIGVGVASILVFAVLGMAAYSMYIHHKQIKAMLQPPLDIPEHIREFFFSELSQHRVALPVSQVTESCEFVTFVQEITDDEDRHALDDVRRNASST